MGIGPLADAQRAAVFLDRDGTLIRTSVEHDVPRPARMVSEVEVLPGVCESLQRLRSAGFRLIVVTNQPDVARGTLARQEVESIHALLARMLPLDEIACCYHDDADNCSCRKPRPGMLIDAARRLDIPLRRSFVVGDRWRDIEAGKRSGCTTILLRQSYSGDDAQADYVAANFSEAAEIILRCAEERR